MDASRSQSRKVFIAYKKINDIYNLWKKATVIDLKGEEGEIEGRWRRWKK
jgi:hypothetical protein